MEEGGTELEAEAKEGELEGAVRCTYEDMELEEGDTELEEDEFSGGGGRVQWRRRESWRGQRRRAARSWRPRSRRESWRRVSWRKRASWWGQRSWRPLSLPPFS